MVRLMYDGITVGNLPSGSLLVAGYLDGVYANVPEMRARFPHATVVLVAVSASYPAARGVVLDVESGDATPAQAVAWCRAYAGPNSDLTVYCDSSTWPTVRAAFAAAGVSEPNYWVADYDGDPTIPAGAVAKQYATNDYYDTSSVSSYWPGVDPAPTPPEEPMTLADAELFVKTLLETRVPEGKLSNGYVPTVADMLNGAEVADTDLTAMKAQIGALSAQVTALSAALAVVVKGEVTAAEVQAAVAAALAAAGHVAA